MTRNPYFNSYRMAEHILEAMIARKEWPCRIKGQEELVVKWYNLTLEHFDENGNFKP